MELTPAMAYGFRLYRDGAVLNMHVRLGHLIIFIFETAVRPFSQVSQLYIFPKFPVFMCRQVDRKQTHIISMIYHIDSESDEPWPILIEDFLGRTHEVILAPGDILFYESSKCMHGRPKAFKGQWYSSIFIHYYPAQVGT